MPILKITNNF